MKRRGLGVVGVAAIAALTVSRLACGEEAATSVAASGGGSASNAVVQQPRSFGYVIGDVATQRVLLEEGGQVFTPREMPATGPAGNWVERRAVRVELDARGHRWLAIDYQILNSPQVLTALALPAWKLASKEGNAELRIAEWPISVSPLTPRQPFARVGLGDLRPDRNASLIDVTATKRWLAVFITALLVTVAAWIAWWAWRNWRASSAQPFARALRELRGLDESSPQAWHALHRAFDGTAGRAVQANTLPTLFKRAPQLEPKRSAIEEFFAQSAARFFGTPAYLQASAQSAAPAHSPANAPARSPEPTSSPTHSLSVRALCADLRQIEKRHEP